MGLDLRCRNSCHVVAPHSSTAAPGAGQVTGHGLEVSRVTGHGSRVTGHGGRVEVCVEAGGSPCSAVAPAGSWQLLAAERVGPESWMFAPVSRPPSVPV